MAMKSGSLNYWRDYFRTASFDIFDIIEHAIKVAASDCPKEFRMQRDRIAELLFSAKLTHCSGCDRLQLAVPAGDDEEVYGGCKSGLDRDCVEFETRASKESKANSSRNDHEDVNIYGDINMNQGFSNFSYGEAEALTNEIEEESQVVGEVLRIKEILCNCEEEAHSVIFESLRRLQLMALTVDILQETEIGKVVCCLRKHKSKEIRSLSKTLYIGWKALAEEWLKAKTTIAEVTLESINPSLVDEEEGLPSPPMDDAFFATQTGAIDISQFFDGMDDYGNPPSSEEHVKNHEKGRKAALDDQNVITKQQQCSRQNNVALNDNKSHQIRKQEIGANLNKAADPLKQGKLSKADSGPGRPLKLVKDQKQSSDIIIQKRVDKTDIRQMPTSVRQDKFKCSEEDIVQMKLEATKRKLQESYQQVEKAKRQRTIQFMELHDLPKQGMGHRNMHVKPGSHNRNWSNGRR